MQTLGQRLRQAREARGLSIEQIAMETRIHADYLRALEGDDPGSCPGGFFYRSFVRQYSRLLGLPEGTFQGEIERSLRAEEHEMDARESQLTERKVDVPPMPTGRTDPIRDLRRWTVRLLVLAAVLAACTATYALYDQWNAVRDFVASKLSPPPAAPVPAAQPPVPVAQTPAPAPAPEVAPPAAAEETPPAAQPEQQPAAAAPAPPVAAATEFGQGAVAVKLSAQDIVWVDVTAGGKRLYQDLMQPGTALTFRGATVRIRLGNAGGVSVTWNGKDVPPLGPRGQVRTVQFSETGYEIILPAKPATATPPAPPDSAGPAE